LGAARNRFADTGLFGGSLEFGQVLDLAGAANRIRTCDPVITNDVLYQLSYCGGPCSAFGNRAENART
jgi:hypothetical protein